jgi:signal transduction histidine kinase
MKNFDLLFNAMFLAIILYQVLYFLVQYIVMKRAELFYYSMFLLLMSVYYFFFVQAVIFNISFNPLINTLLSSVKFSLTFLTSLFYILFILHYLGLKKNKDRTFTVCNYFKYYNLVFTLFFFLISLLKIESISLFHLVTFISLLFSTLVLFVLWRIKSIYSKVILYGTSFTLIGVCLTHTFIMTGGNPNDPKPDTYLPLQISQLFEVFILGYGLSLKAAETDKKLVQTLIENQQIVETERSRLAKDLHDGLGGLLSGIKLTLIGVADKVPQENTVLFTKANNQLDTAIREMRRVAHNMMPEALLKFGLGEAIQDYCDGINESNMVKMKYIQIGSLQGLTQSAEIVLYRIVQELTNNALKHAAAKNIFVQITKHPRGITVTVEDDGNGFDTAILHAGKGQGLKNVQSRVEYLKGEYDIKTEKGNGTSINIEIPV